MLTAAEFRAACRRVMPWQGSRTRCPSCREKLAPRRAIVIATRHCPECGCRVLAETPDREDLGELTPVSEFRAAADRFNAVFALILLLGFLAWLASCIGGLWLSSSRYLMYSETA